MGAAVELTPQREVSWALLTAVVAGRVYRAIVLTWAVVALGATLFGAVSHVIRSGSMEPSISVGDVVVASDVTADDRIAVGRVYVFEDPARAERTLVHRIVERRDDGDFTTAGDANEHTDHLALSRNNIEERAVLLVPWIGSPVAWAAEGAWLKLSGWLGVTMLAFLTASRSIGGGRGSTGRGGDTPAPRDSSGRRRRAMPAAAVLVAALPLVYAAQPTVADAAFTSRTNNGSNTWQAGQWRQPYVDAVLADSPSLFWLLDEVGGTSANDRSGNGRTGRYTDIAGYKQSGGLPNNFGYSVRPGGTGRVVDAGPATTAPDTFSLELWFRTTTTRGGRLMGFESTRDATSARSDRTVHMTDEGRIAYGAWGLLPRVEESPRSYNDGQWHHLVVVTTDDWLYEDTTLYVDGRAVASGWTSRTPYNSGWWRVGYGTKPTGRTAPTSAGFDGFVDNVAVYPRALSSARIAEHYRVR